MDLHPTPFPVKSQYMKPKPSRKIPDSSKNNKKVAPPVISEKRVFGVARNPNIPLKTVPSNPVKPKPSSGPLKKATKPSQPTRSPNPARPKTKNVCFEVEKIEKSPGDGNNPAEPPRTPAKSPACRPNPRLSVTPYHSAEKCSKCRFDRLETSSYWLCQIKLAETVGKHTVSAAFFRLAFDCEAQPVRNIRVELKKYVARHEYLNGEEEWKKLFVSYGLVKKDLSGCREVDARADEENASVENQEDTDLLNEIAEEIECFLNVEASNKAEKKT